MNETEKKTVTRMIRIYCKAKHNLLSMCEECVKINEYALKRLDKCQFGESKPSCQKCPVHCYKPDTRKQMQEIMRYSGPRMIFHSPILAIKHLIKNKRNNRLK